MTLTHILILAVLSIPFMRLVPAQSRPWGLLIGSVLGITWFISDGTLTGLDFMLVMATLILTVMVWWVIQPDTTQDQQTLLLLSGLAVVLGIGTWLFGDHVALSFLLGFSGLTVVMMISAAALLEREQFKGAALGLVILIIVILIVIKVPGLARFFGMSLDWDAEALSSASPFVWLGFSYMGFRLIGLLQDYRAGRLPKGGFSLRDMAVYTLFFPAFTAGPIDQARRFVPEMNQAKPLDASRLIEGSTRIAVGVFKKFIIADSLALVAMNPTLIDQTSSTGGLWVLLYLYAFQIFFDFSGYSDVAIGLGRLYGITLPENFDRPYTQANIQQFWQRWHITLSTWFRVYFFTPFSRMLIRSPYKIPQWAIILVCQMATMILIGLWHGVTLNFLLWGAWHGVGLFAHKMLADNTKKWHKWTMQRAWTRYIMVGGSVFATFHFVALGWVFFALPETSQSLDMLRRLFGG